MKRAADEAAELNRTVDELRTQLATITTERDALKAQITSGGSTDSVALLTSQVEALTQEKVNLEKALAEARAVSAVVSASEPNTVWLQKRSHGVPLKTVTTPRVL
jgi:seryl-tRNA synthetase